MTTTPPATTSLNDVDDWNTTNPDIPVVAARVRNMSREDWMQHAIQLAWKHHTVGKLVYIGIDITGVSLFAAPSSSMPGHQYEMRMDLTHKTISCPCRAAAYGYPCAHIGALWIYLRQLLSRMTPTGPLPPDRSTFETGPLLPFNPAS